MADEQEIQRELSETDRQALENVIWLLTRDLTQLNVKVIELKSAIATVERMLDSTGRARQETDNG